MFSKNSLFHTFLYSSDKLLFDNKVHHVLLPGKEGLFSIYNQHAPIIASLKQGSVVITLANDSTKTFNLEKGGIIEMKDNILRIFSS